MSMKTFRTLIHPFIGKKISFNIGVEYAGSGTLAEVHEDCVEIHHFDRPVNDLRGPLGLRKQFVQFIHLHSIAEADAQR